jgi:Holliday junction resolvase
MVKTYHKGARAERELIKFFSERGFMVIRGAGSGTSGLSPDVLVFRGIRQYVIEAKAFESEHLSLDRDQFENLKKWNEVTGMETYVAWRRKKQKPGDGADKTSAESLRRSGVGMQYRWRFIPIAFFKENPKSYSLSWEIAEKYGKDLSELV